MPHKPELDGLRALAFLAVFAGHARPDRFGWGGAGVEFFFALSGFLITRILERGESGRVGADLRRFYARRALRIFPLYYALVLAAGPGAWRGDLGWLLAYSYNVRAYLAGGWNDVLGHFWTLAVEEQFYLLYPPILLLTPARLRLPLLAALLAGAKGFQVYAQHHLAMPWARLLLPYCGEHLLWGGVAGLVELRTRAGRFEGLACLGLGAPLVALATVGRGRLGPTPAGWGEVGTASLFGAGSALVAFGAWRSSGGRPVAPLRFAPLAYLGRISYGLYAFHLPVLRDGWLDAIPYGFLAPRPWGELALTIALAAAAWRFFEGPIHRLKGRIGATNSLGAGPSRSPR